MIWGRRELRYSVRAFKELEREGAYVHVVRPLAISLRMVMIAMPQSWSLRWPFRVEEMVVVAVHVLSGRSWCSICIRGLVRELGGKGWDAA